jgi:hypothetical protein
MVNNISKYPSNQAIKTQKHNTEYKGQSEIMLFYRVYPEWDSENILFSYTFVYNYHHD